MIWKIFFLISSMDIWILYVYFNMKCDHDFFCDRQELIFLLWIKFWSVKRAEFFLLLLQSIEIWDLYLVQTKFKTYGYIKSWWYGNNRLMSIVMSLWTCVDHIILFFFVLFIFNFMFILMFYIIILFVIWWYFLIYNFYRLFLIAEIRLANARAADLFFDQIQWVENARVGSFLSPGERWVVHIFGCLKFLDNFFF